MISPFSAAKQAALLLFILYFVQEMCCAGVNLPAAANKARAAPVAAKASAAKAHDKKGEPKKEAKVVALEDPTTTEGTTGTTQGGMTASDPGTDPPTNAPGPIPTTTKKSSAPNASARYVCVLGAIVLLTFV